MRYNWIFASLLAALIAVTGCGGGGSSSSNGSNSGNPIPVVSPSSSASQAPVSQSAFICPSSDTASSSALRAGAVSASHLRRLPRRTAHGSANSVVATTQLVAVSYDRASAASSQRAMAASESAARATFRRELDFPHIGVKTRILAVPTASLARALVTLRAAPGVRSVGMAGGRRYPLAVTFPYYTNDPYFTGFANPTPANGVPQSSTYEMLPYAESAGVPGQWNLHAAQFERAFAYSQPSNGSNVTNGNALGSSNVKIAIIDSGADTSQPDLGPKIAYQRCFITYTTDGGSTQSTSNYVTDPDGHGTNVSGIAGAVSGNGLGFTAAGGNSTLYEYRVDPTPDDACSVMATQNNPECGADVDDVVSAIQDAVSRGVKVISMSLGSYASDGTSSGCNGTADLDAAEGNAVADALAANIVVVAAAGNGGGAALTAPACDAGVIAVGASALADGSPNGAGNSNGSVAAPVEYVASYSGYGSPGAAFRNTGAWGIVAPGGDPVDGQDQDNLHWINDLWTSTPFDSSTDGGTCGPDYPDNTSEPSECSTLIAGTSMATPTVAGAAALILAVNNSYSASGRMKSLLCSTADDIADSHEGCGRLNIYRAMAVALGDTTPP